MAIRASGVVNTNGSAIEDVTSLYVSPYIHQNKSFGLQQIFIVGGTVTEVCVGHNMDSMQDTGMVSGAILLRPNDFMSVSYKVSDAPSIKIHQL